MCYVLAEALQIVWRAHLSHMLFCRYTDKWIATQIFPLFVVGLLGVAIVAACALRTMQEALGSCRRSASGERSFRELDERWNAVISTAVAFLRALAGYTDIVIGAIFTVRNSASAGPTICVSMCKQRIAKRHVQTQVLYFTYMVTMSRSLEVFKCTYDTPGRRWTLDAGAW